MCVFRARRVEICQNTVLYPPVIRTHTFEDIVSQVLGDQIQLVRSSLLYHTKTTYGKPDRFVFCLC